MRSNKKYQIVIVLLAALLLRLINLNQSFWLDEAAQMIESVRPFSQQFQLAADFHPPLYHLVLHFWLYLGTSEVHARMLSVIFALGSIYFIYLLVKHKTNEHISFLSAFFLSISPFHIWYSQEVRPYMLFCFLSVLSSYLLLKKKWLVYTISLVLLLYSSYFSFFLVIGQIIYILIFQKKNFRKIFVGLFSAFILYLPWLPSLYGQLKIGLGGAFAGWTSVVSTNALRVMPLTFAKFSIGKGDLDLGNFQTWLVLPTLLLFLYSVWRIFQKREGREILTITVFSFVPAVAVSFFLPVAAPQRFIFLLPFFYLIFAVGIASSKRVISLTSFSLILVISLMGIYNYYTDPYIQREDWKSAVEFVERDQGQENLALFIFPDPFAPYLWYESGAVASLGISKNFVLRQEDLEREKGRISQKNKVYLFQYLTGLTDPDNLADEFLQKLGFENTSTEDFPGVGFVYVYEK